MSYANTRLAFSDTGTTPREQVLPLDTEMFKLHDKSVCHRHRETTQQSNNDYWTNSESVK